MKMIKSTVTAIFLRVFSIHNTLIATAFGAGIVLSPTVLALTQFSMPSFFTDTAWEKVVTEDQTQEPFEKASLIPIAHIHTSKTQERMVYLSGINAETFQKTLPHSVVRSLQPLPDKARVKTDLKVLKHLAVGHKITIVNDKGEAHAYEVTKLNVKWPTSVCGDTNMPKRDIDLLSCGPKEKTKISKSDPQYEIEIIRLVVQPDTSTPSDKKNTQHES